MEGQNMGVKKTVVRLVFSGDVETLKRFDVTRSNLIGANEVPNQTHLNRISSLSIGMQHGEELTLAVHSQRAVSGIASIIAVGSPTSDLFRDCRCATIHLFNDIPLHVSQEG